MTKLDPTPTRGFGEPVRLPPRKSRPLLDLALPATAVGSGVMLGMAVPAMLDASSFWDYAKALALAFSATAVSYGVNKLAIERGAELGTTGYRGATIVSIGSILAVGSGLFAATYAGLTLKDTGELQLQQHGQALSLYVGARSGAASAAAKVIPAIRATEADLSAKAACELATSCISGHRNGGNGTVARVVQMQAVRASSISQQITVGETAREQIIRRLNDDIAAYQTILNNGDLAFRERRAKLQAVDARIRQAIGDLDAVVPLSLVAAYAGELQAGVSVVGRPEVEARLGALLSQQGKSLATVIEGIEEVRTVPPVFPPRPGVSDTFGYIPHLLPIAAIAAVVELIFPLVLWAYTFWSLAWSKHKEDPPDAAEQVLQLPKPPGPPVPHAPAQDDTVRRLPGRPRRPNGSNIADPEAYFRGPAAWRAPDDDRFGNTDPTLRAGSRP
ncbi:hypothetical protein [Methylobacterium marchantiae]|uniref:DUF4407 domain-containing protein n=1 Tax=Methylobacterium marchantiae TaxID=600331 RepID=A0ABW3WX49_9HYPH|nr:hypothetical protein AIGOOFII_3145 [Methylobacterium marchantiae]